MDAITRDVVGPNGRWQVTTFIGASIISVIGSFMTFISSFTTYLPTNYRCLIPECESENESIYSANFTSFTIPEWNLDSISTRRHCYNFKPISAHCNLDSFDPNAPPVLCRQHVFDRSQYNNSLVMQLDIPPCTNFEDDWPLDPLITRVQFLGFGFMFGLLIGSFVTGIGSDWIGRKKMMFISLAIGSVCVLAGGIWGSDFWVYVALRGLNGIFCIALFLNSFVILVEMVAPDKRDFYGLILSVPFAGGELILSLLAYLFQEWSHLHFCIGIISLVSITTAFIIPESPRWLLSVGKRQEAIAVLKRGAIRNGRKNIKDSDFKVLESLEENSEPKLSLLKIFGNKEVVIIAIIMFFNWFSINSVYYGLSMISVNLGGNIYLNFFLSGLVEIPSYLLTIPLLSKIGRKHLFVSCSLIGGITSITAGFSNTQNQHVLSIVSSLTGKFCVSSCFSVLYLYTAELFPTEVRNSILGISSMIGRIGGMIAPFIATLGTVSTTLPFNIMGALAIVGGLFALFLPETLGAPLPETLNDITALKKNPTPLYLSLKRSKSNSTGKIETNE